MKKITFFLFITYITTANTLNAQEENKKITQYMMQEEYTRIIPTDILYRHLKKTNNVRLLKQYLNAITHLRLEAKNGTNDVKVYRDKNTPIPPEIYSIIEKGNISDNISTESGKYIYYWKKDFGFRITQIYNNDTFDIAIMNVGGWKHVPRSMKGNDTIENLTEKEEFNLRKTHPDFAYPRQFPLRPDLKETKLKFEGIEFLNTGSNQYYCYQVSYNNNNNKYCFDIENKFLVSRTGINSSINGVSYKSKFIFENYKEFKEFKIFMPTTITEQIIDGNVSFIYSANSIECNVKDVDKSIVNPKNLISMKEEKKKNEPEDEEEEDDDKEPSFDMFNDYDTEDYDE